MAENKDGMEKSEQPSSRRLEQAREKGQVPTTKELGPVFVFFGAMGMIAVWAPIAWRNLHQSSRHWFEQAGTVTLTPDTAYQTLLDVIQNGFLPILPLAIVLGFLGVGAMLMQTGLLWVEDGLKPKISKLNPVSGLKKIVSVRGAAELIKSLIKLGIIGLIAYLVARNFVPGIVSLPSISISEAIAETGFMAFQLVLWIGLVLLALAVADYVFQKWQFMRDQRMTKQEVKDEMKDVEGNPLIRSRRQSLQRDRARQRMMQTVPQADVVITNPTHLAVALRYDSDAGTAPTVLAKGAGFVAERIKEIARNAGVPIIENKSLARGLFKLVGVGKEIPNNLYKAVAEVLAYVYRLQQERDEATR